MELAFTSKLPVDFSQGGTLAAVAKAHDDDGWIAVTFLTDNQILENKHDFPNCTAPFQLQLRLNHKIAILNNCVDQCWGEEERYELGVDPDEKIKIKIKCTEECFEVQINRGHLAHFKHREDASSITHVNVYGDCVIEKFKVK